MAEAGAAKSGSKNSTDPLFYGSCLCGSERISVKKKEETRRYFVRLVEDQMEDERSEMPSLQIVMFPDLVAKAWGWERLLPICPIVEWSDYAKYLQAYYNNNAGTAAETSTVLADVANRCLKKENQLAFKWKMLLESHVDVISLRQNIILSSLIKERAHSVIRKEGSKSSGSLVGAAFMCIDKETDLILELLSRGARPNDFFIEESCKIRMCALRLMGHSDIAAGAMLGIAKETSMMCEWMSKRQKRLRISCLSLPDYIEEGKKIRQRTLEFMTSILTVPYNHADVVLKPVMEAKGTIGNDASDKLNPEDEENIIDTDISKKSNGIEETKREMIKGCMLCWLTKHSHHGIASHCSCCSPIKLESERVETGAAMSSSVTIIAYAPHLGNGDTVDCEKTTAKCPDVHVEKTWGFRRLLPFNDSVKWSDYIDYLREYSKRLTPEVYSADRARNIRAAADFCLKMEENLLSGLRISLSAAPAYMVPVKTIVESSLIRDCAHSSFCTEGEELSFASAIAFVCIAMEADLICELLRHGARHTDDIIEQSSVIRLCALSFLNLKGDQSVLAAIMVGIARETKMICDWIKREKKDVNFSSSTPHELEESRFIRNRSSDVMITIVQQSYFQGQPDTG